MYGEDLAYVHALGFADFSVRAAPELLALMAQHGMHAGTVVDLGCGAGHWLRALSNAGYESVGIDASPSFVRLARLTAPRANVHHASFWSYAFPPCTAVTALGEVLNYLPSRAGRRPSLKALFERVHSALCPGGLFVFDMLTDSPGRPMDYRTWKTGTDWAVLVEVNEDRKKGEVHRNITTFRIARGAYRRSSERHVLRTPSRQDVVNMLREVGFTIRTSRSYGRVNLPTRRTMFRARHR